MCHMSLLKFAQYADLPIPLKKKVLDTKEIIVTVWEIGYLANINDTLFHHKSPVHQGAQFPGGDNMQQTDFPTYRLNRPRGLMQWNH